MARRARFCERAKLTDLYEKERTLYREVSSRVERSLPESRSSRSSSPAPSG